MSEADAAEAEFIADVNEVIGLQAEDDITTQAPLSTVDAIGVYILFLVSVFFAVSLINVHVCLAAALELLLIQMWHV